MIDWPSQLRGNLSRHGSRNGSDRCTDEDAQRLDQPQPETILPLCGIVSTGRFVGAGDTREVLKYVAYGFEWVAAVTEYSGILISLPETVLDEGAADIVQSQAIEIHGHSKRG